MSSKDSRTEQLLLELEEYRSRVAKDGRTSRRRLLKSIAGNTVVSAVGIGGLLELLASREVIAAGTQISFLGVTRERTPVSETPHRHTFSAAFQVTSVTPYAITGNVVGRADTVISTSNVKEDQHFHVFSQSNVSLEQLILTGPEDNEAGGHVHQVSIE
jgi:hypothetical protein